MRLRRKLATQMRRLLGILGRRIDFAASPAVEYINFRHEKQLILNFSLAARRRSLFHFLLALRLAFQMGLAHLLAPLCYILKRCGYRFVFIDLAQIGSIMFLDLFLRENFTSKNTPKHKLLLCRSNYSDANRVALDLYDPYVTFVKSPVWKLFLVPFFVSDISSERVFHFETAESFHDPDAGRRTRVAEAYNAYSQRFSKQLVSLSPELASEGRLRAARVFDTTRPFVTLHVRDSGFYGDSDRTTRNADIKTYEPAIHFLIDLGYTVVRMGDPAMVPIDDMIARCGGNLVDYARSDWRSELMDCYLVSQSAFFIGCASGLWGLAMAFGTPCCNMNFYTASTCLGMSPKDLSIFKKFRYVSDDSLVPFETIMYPPFSQNPQRNVLAAHGCYLEDNTATEILESVKEFVTRTSESPSELQLRAKQLMSPSNWSYGSEGNFSHAILKAYFPEMVGKQREGSLQA